MRSPLDRFTDAPMPNIQDAYPTAVFNGIDLDCLNEWVQYKGAKLLAIPFKNDAYSLDKHDSTLAKKNTPCYALQDFYLADALPHQ